MSHRPVPDGAVLNIAHRGASAAAPENTLAAVRRAVRDGADLVEVDVRRTSDGALVLLHDATLVRTTDVRRHFPGRAPWRVTDFSLGELRTLDAGGWWARHHAGEQVPMLGELLDEVRGSGVGVQLELKEPGSDPGIVRDLAAELATRPAVDRTGVVVQSFDFAAMKELKTLLPEVPVGLLGAPAVPNLPALASWADQVNPWLRAVDAGYVGRLHDLGLECRVWTVDRPWAMRRALRFGADGVITNRPAVLARVLAGAGRVALPVPG
jgi:glycerophosphoryl diester phosphodiesterase